MDKKQLRLLVCDNCTGGLWQYDKKLHSTYTHKLHSMYLSQIPTINDFESFCYSVSYMLFFVKNRCFHLFSALYWGCTEKIGFTETDPKKL